MKERNNTCHKCNSKEVVPIFYGMSGMDPVVQENWEESLDLALFSNRIIMSGIVTTVSVNGNNQGYGHLDWI